MAQPVHPAHQLQDNSPTAGRTSSVLLFAGAVAGGLVVLGALALWFHYGSQVFFEMIRTGFAACF
jgi:hypothetical protein